MEKEQKFSEIRSYLEQMDLHIITTDLDRAMGRFLCY